MLYVCLFLNLFENIFCYSYHRKIIDKQHFPYIFNGLFRYFGGVTLMSFNHLSLSADLILYVYLYIKFI